MLFNQAKFDLTPEGVYIKSNNYELVVKEYLNINVVYVKDNKYTNFIKIYYANNKDNKIYKKIVNNYSNVNKLKFILDCLEKKENYSYRIDDEYEYDDDDEEVYIGPVIIFEYHGDFEYGFEIKLF